MSYLTQVALVLWDHVMPSTDLFKLVNIIPNVTIFGFLSNLALASFHLQMANNPLSGRDLSFISEMIVHRQVGLQHVLTFSTKEKFPSCFL